MNALVYRSTQVLECQCDSAVIFCVSASLTASGKPFIDGTLVSTSLSGMITCGKQIYAYQLEYDPQLLADPTHILTASEITGIICRGCLTQYIDAKESTPVEPICANQGISEGILVACNAEAAAPIIPTVLGQVPMCSDAVTGKVQFKSINSRIVFTIGDSSSVITTGAKKCLEITEDCVITGWKVLSDDPSTTAGDIEVDIWKNTYASYPPTVLDTIITGGVKPNIPATSTKGISINVTNWTTAISAGDILRFNVDSVHSLKSVTLILEVRLV